METRTSQKIVIAGGTGLVGARLVRQLHQAGHLVHVLTRSGRGQDVEGLLFQGWEALPEVLEDAAALINLSGEGIVDQAWTPARKAHLRESRIGSTRRLVEALKATNRPPAVLVNASAIGIYGPTGEASADESAPEGTGFLAELCREWEEAAQSAEPLGVRVVRLRLGVVLAKEGGALPRMALPVRFFAGSRLGSGTQALSWIHLDDLVRMIEEAALNPAWQGAINATAPRPCTQAELVRALADHLRRPLWPVPAWITALALRLVLGERASMLLAPCAVIPGKALSLGFEFRFQGIRQAVEDLL